MMPAPSALNVQCGQAPSTAPANPPMISRAAKIGGAVRGGVLGSLSLTNSPTASTVKTMTVMMLAIQDAHVPCRSIQPRYAAHATTAGAVKDRNPATTPISNASNKTRTCVTETLLGYEQPGDQKRRRPAPQPGQSPSRTLTQPGRQHRLGDQN